MPASLVTDFKCIAQSGNTVDGRVIKPEWLTEMAETYDPAVYTAKLWIDHMRYMSYGSVHALKTEKKGDVIRLFAKISPTRALLTENQVWEEKLHFSIEPTEDFAKTGKTYLTGLAMTDNPASLGTDEMRFSLITGRTFTGRYPGEKVPDLRESAAEEDQDVETFFKRMLTIFQTNKQDQQGEDPMEKEQFEKLNTGIATLNEAMTGMVDVMAKFTPQPAPAAKPAAPTEPAAAPVEDDKFTTLSTALEGLTGKFDTLLGQLKTQTPGTQFEDTTQPVEDADALY